MLVLMIHLPLLLMILIHVFLTGNFQKMGGVHTTSKPFESLEFLVDVGYTLNYKGSADHVLVFWNFRVKKDDSHSL